jgi:hypothetical protein
MSTDTKKCPAHEAGQSSEQKTQSKSILTLTNKAFNAISFVSRISAGDLVLALSVAGLLLLEVFK